ncbi:peptidylprolyl isomerase [Acidithiobacillus thiooxidans]|uniref:peptidylprolyl isomerase n=1 Tax=Acidithiobacillus thiooxidans TaxID=930 RepID=UPI001C07CBC1|nr:peptidylprolyl isomerase [Acidithiobacillus thiooxidans]MBU2838647.1 peptidylprolyl isomerase [Acidithiobacillus thiooxidans]
MMDVFRNFGQSFIAKIIMVLIALSFVLWGVSGYLMSGSSGPAVVASVNGQKITEAVFHKRLEEAQERYNHVFGAATAAKMAQQSSFAHDVLNGLIDNILLGTEAGRLGLQVSDTALAKKVEAIPAFQEKGVFSKAKYQKLLAANGMTPAQFEGMLRESMRLEQLQVIPQIVASASDQAATEVWGWSQEYRDIKTVTITDAHFAEQAKPDTAEVQSFYQSHLSEFHLPAEVEVHYVVMGPHNFLGANQASAKGVTAAAASGSKNSEQADQAAENAFQAQVENFKDRLFSSPDGLQSVAKAYHLTIESSGQLTAGKQASSGPFADPKALDLAFSKAVLAGKNSSALTLKNGDLLAVHLLHYTPGRAQTLAAVKNQIVAQLTAEKATQLAKSKAEALLASARKAGKVEVLTADGTYPVQVHLNVTRKDARGLSPTLLSAAFDAPAPIKHIPSMGMVRGQNGYTLFAVTQVMAPSSVAVNPKVTAEIRASLEEQRGRLLSAAYLRDLRDHAKVKIDNAKLAAASSQ